jgi:hypothetical protein
MKPFALVRNETNECMTMKLLHFLDFFFPNQYYKYSLHYVYSKYYLHHFNIIKL